MKTVSGLISLIFASSLFLSCSLKYDEGSESKNITPELKFENLQFRRYEDEKITMKLYAEQMEQYKGNGSAYAKKTSFETWDSEGNLTSEGSCILLGMDREKETYLLFNDIIMNNIEQNFKIYAQKLKWDSKTKQLTSSADEKIYLLRDDVEMEGYGFSASGVSKSFSFEKPVTGTITTKDDQEEGDQ